MSQIDGTADLIRKLKAISKDADKTMKKSITKWTEYVRGEAVDLCPVKSGELQQSIFSNVKRDGDSYKGVVYTDKEYAPYVEFGTGIRGEESGAETSPDVHVTYSGDIKGQAAQPFLYPALNNNKNRIKKGVKQDLKDAIKGAKVK